MSEGKTFREAYAVLQKHAQTLRSQQEPDIDNLTTIVQESLDAYKVCKERIDAVERALEQSLGHADRDADDAEPDQLPAPSAAASAASPASGADDDDIPF